MCVCLPCVHTVESHNEIAHSECPSKVKYFGANFTLVHYTEKVTGKNIKY